MKKLIIVCTIMALALAMAMPCFAAGEKVKGTYTFAPNIDISGFATPEGNFCPLTFTHEGVQYSGVKALGPAFGGYALYFVPADGGENLYAYYQPTGEYEGFEAHWNVGRVVSLDTEIPFDIYLLMSVWGKFSPKPIEVGTLAEFLENFKEQISVKTVVQLLVVLATAVVGIVFMWWGVRKLSRAVFSAFRKGKISV